MNYSKETIVKLTGWIEGEASSLNWLIANGYKELALLKPALFDDDRKSYEWLVQNKKLVLAAFVRAVRDDKNAFEWLMKNKLVTWAATSNAVNKDREAMMWLQKNGYMHFADLAVAIQRKFKQLETGDIDFLVKGPIK